jgi:ABC-type antimicrobial peptide transport system permease subunit
VIKDFQFEPFTSLSNWSVFIQPGETCFVMMKLQAGKEKEAIAALQTFYPSFNPGFSFSYKFMDEDYQALYESEQRVAILSRYFAGLAIIISCLGLFGLAAFTAERRQKEIGIRKILGSGEWRIIYLLSGDFTRMVIVAIAMALPISYYLMKEWLSNFSEHISLNWWYFGNAALVALVVAWLTVGLQTIRAARVNPAQCLKTE